MSFLLHTIIKHVLNYIYRTKIAKTKNLETWRTRLPTNHECKHHGLLTATK